MSTAPVKWFLQLRGTVQGPFNNDNLLKAIQAAGDDAGTQGLVWRRGLSEWIRANQWQKADQQITAAMSRGANSPSVGGKSPAAPASSAPPPRMETAPPPRNPPPPQPAKSSPAIPVPNPIPTQRPAPTETATMMNPATQVTVMAQGGDTRYDDEHTRTVVDNELFEKTFTQAFSDGQFYRVQLNYVDQPLMSKNELVQLIAKQEDISAISIQDSKTKEWKEIYAYPDLVEKLGISRRKSQRVPILAQFSGKSSKSNSVSYRVITISEGGMGFTENFDLKIGDEVQGQITSPHFFQPISVKAEVIYAGLDGYIGLKFSNVTDETKSAIIQYIKKFGKNQK